MRQHHAALVASCHACDTFSASRCCCIATSCVAGQLAADNSAKRAQVQGVLTSAATVWPHIHISDSLVMADSAVRMAEAGCEAIAVLGVDFMSENVRAILDEAGYTDVRVIAGGFLLCVCCSAIA